MFRFLFQPIGLRGLLLPNRIICGPMEKNLCTEQGAPTSRYADYVEERARGGAGLILLESAYVHPSGRARRFQMGIHDDQVIKPLRRLVDRAHRHGAAVGMQLHHGGRTCQQAISGIVPMAPSPVPCQVLAGGDLPREMTIQDIESTLCHFQQAALRCLAAGVDLIQIHGAHGYLVGQFLSPYSNRRQDEYGGTFAKRCRFPLEVVRAVRAVIGPQVPLAYRLSADEFWQGGLGLDDTLAFARLLQNEAVDLIDLSAGIYESGVMMVQPMEFPAGGYVYMARAFKQVVSTPISVAGRISDPHQAENILAEGSADLVTMTRAFHADPHLVRKARQGRSGEICLCIACNQGCTDRLRENVPLSCILNPRSGHERQFALRPAPRPRSVWVAGGGPAGLMAARVCALRGHSVVLFEREAELGGQARYLARVDHKADFGQGLRYLINEVKRARVELRLEQELSPALLAQGQPQVLILALGAEPRRPELPGLAGVRVLDYLQALRNPQALGGRIVIAGGGMIACETAWFLAQRGQQVVLCNPGFELAPDLGPRAKWFVVQNLPQHPRVTILTETRLLGGENGRLRLRQRGETRWWEDFDCLVWADERVPRRLPGMEPSRRGSAMEVHLVGDCHQVGNITGATREAMQVAVAV